MKTPLLIEEIKMLTKKLSKRLSRQINLEMYSSNLYLQMSSWCENQGLEGSAKFLQQHAEEEMQHMQRLFRYVNETGSMVKLGTIKAPPTEFSSIAHVFEAIYEHECMITSEINNLVKITLKEEDFSTHNFLQWYVAEQHEEENLFKSILDKISMIGLDTASGLFFIDKAIEDMLNDKEVAAIE